MYAPSLKCIYNTLSRSRPAAISASLIIALFAIYSYAPSGQSSSSSSPTSPSKSFSNVTIKNFGQMDDHFYRGAQPTNEEYKELAELGIKSVIDLRDDPMPYAKSAAEAVHMTYLNIPMSDKDYPRNEDVEAFLKMSNEDKNWPFYVHCAGGRHRTGLMGAMYRFNHDGWDYNRAYEEMKNYDFYTRWGHGAIKKYVQDYWQHFHAKAVAPSAAKNKQDS